MPKSKFTPEEDAMIIEAWPDYRSCAMKIEGKSTTQVRARGRYLGLESSGVVRLTEKEKSEQIAINLAKRYSN